MSWNSSHSVEWTDATISTFVGWVQLPKFAKETVGWTDGIGSGSSDALGFAKVRAQPLQHRMIWRSDQQSIRRLHSNYTDTCQNIFFSIGWTDASDPTQRFIRRLRLNYTVLHRVGALQHRMVRWGVGAMRRCIDWITCFNGYFSAFEWPDDPTLAQRAPSVHPTVLLFQRNFSNG
jgi:hypothetical protein